MPLPSSGAISLSQVNVELGRSSTAQISMNESAVRTLFGKASGAISISDGYGKANEFAFTIASNQTNADLRTLAVNAGWNQSTKVVCTINSGIYVSSNTTGGPALTVTGSFPNGVELVNDGFIVGMGGNGGRGGGSGTGLAAALAGSPGGLALSASVAVSIRNNGTIGGGGGGGGGGPRYASDLIWGGGGGGGGHSGAAANSAGGARGNTNTTQFARNSTAGGPGTVSGAGAGGLGAIVPNGSRKGGDGGNGGARGASGAPGQTITGPPDSKTGATSPIAGAAGGSGGAAVSGNSNITWLATGTRLGAIA